MPCRPRPLGFSGVGFRTEGLRLRGLGVEGLGFGVQWFRVQDLGFMVQALEFGNLEACPKKGLGCREPPNTGLLLKT